ncbi:MAG TPA: hypothetical protein PK271_04775 [Hyphomicrobium sp.]|uniref:hypothetical protein n=1 Tax=Hyphomicrobium sp. TaxID=82 RepID=UPI002C730211|nr:hypothetical protein [Hyphomicrobium sp.]HRN87895.1 hypothetical protein [Hyphomicrobium sp.]
MDPATLYLLVQLANGREHVYREHLETMAGCERFRAWVVERKPGGHEILNSVCWPLGAEPLAWTNRPIQGVPLDSKYR